MSKISELRKMVTKGVQAVRTYAPKACDTIAELTLPKDQFYRYQAQVSKGWWGRKQAYLKLLWSNIKNAFSTLKALFTKK